MQGKPVNPGLVEAEAIVTDQMFGFWGGVDTSTGEIIDARHPLCGQNIRDKVFVFPEGRGSTVGAAVILELVRCGVAPAAIVNLKTEGILASGAILADKFYGFVMPVVDSLSPQDFATIRSGDRVRVDGERGEVTVVS